MGFLDTMHEYNDALVAATAEVEDLSQARYGTRSGGYGTLCYNPPN